MTAPALQRPPAQRHLSLVPPPAPQPTVTVVKWWTCPTWCDPTECFGGETFTFPDTGRPVDTGVVHQRTLATFQALSDEADENVTVILRREQADCPGDPGTADLVLRIGDSGIRVTAAVAAKLKSLAEAAGTAS